MYRKLDFLNLVIWLLTIPLLTAFGVHYFRQEQGEDGAGDDGRLLKLAIVLLLCVAIGIILTFNLRVYYKVVRVAQRFYGHERIIASSIQIGVENPERTEEGNNWAYVETVTNDGVVKKRYLWLPAVHNYA